MKTKQGIKISRVIYSILIIALIASIINPIQVNAASRTKKNAYKAYYKWMKSSEAKVYSGSGEKYYKKYSLIDLNKDGIPELIAANPQYLNSNCYDYKICSFNGTTVETVSLSENRATVGFIPKTGKLNSAYLSGAMGDFCSTIYKINKKGNIVRIANLSEYGVLTPSPSYKINDKSVNKKTFVKKSKKIYNNKKEKGFHTLKFTSRKKMLKKLK